MLKYFLSGFAVFAFIAVQAPAYAAGAAATTEKTEKAASTTETKKPKREMSEKQKKNVAIMKECGAEWKAAKAAGTVKGQKWRDYLKDCRAKKKAA
jgi:hypothetical protein